MATSQSQKSVSDRLIGMGKVYEAKKQRLRQEAEYRRRQTEIDQVVPAKGKKT